MGVSLSLPNIGKSPLTISSGDLAKQANGSVVVSYGDTVVLATACMGKEPKPGGFLPLTIEYQEKTYAMGKIPGGYIKREGRPKDEEILCARIIDRPLRPLFPKDFTNEVQIVAMVLSSDGVNDPDVHAINGASCALLISDIPFFNPVAAVRIVKGENGFIVNPTYEEFADNPLEMIVVGTEDKITMLEGKLSQISEQEVLEAIKYAHPFIQNIIKLQKDLQKKIGKEKKEVAVQEVNEELFAKVRSKLEPQVEGMYGLANKEDREKAASDILNSVYEEVVEKVEPEITLDEIKGIFYEIEEEVFRRKIMKEGKRPDGRKLTDIRNIDSSVRVLTRTHGSALFTRGQTQALAVTTLGGASDEQMIDALEGLKTKHFMLHYAFPPFSVGEIKFMRGPSRRDIGHGALAEKAISDVLPAKQDFPYTIRVVSEILESNGSSSMATVCATSLSLMDAGVPIKEPVAGIAIGVVTDDNDNYKILTDIAGVEDHCGDMDFKVAGTKKGITAIQLDIKIGGLTYQILEEASARAKENRLTILDKMNQALSAPREMVSEYAPKIKSFPIDPDKIGNVIGPGGKIIRKIQRDYSVSIDIDDELGVVSIVAESQEALEKVVKIVTSLTKDIEAGEIFEEAKVTRIANFGAFCEIVPGKQGLVHVSEISDTYVKDVSTVLKEGDVVKVKVIGIDAQGRINLSIKQAQ